ncbi:MAG: hypothetical protein VXX39_03670, partial [Candidatus Thermoplasmatota archaeon]|nr:hypothetical protein [Candidatus Thermoplasmatota archaeon]
MSGEDESQSPDQATDNLAVANQELTQEEKSARNGQILSMAGMMGMFIITILLGLVIRPFYDSNNLQAFGESGTTQARYVILQLSMIFIFTAIILALAKWKKDWIIKYGIMGIMAIALLYSTVPLAHVILVEDMTEDFNIDSTDTYDTNYATATWSQNGFLTTIESDGQNNTTDTYHYWEGGDSIAGEPSWSATVPHSPADVGSEVRAVQGQMNGD